MKPAKAFSSISLKAMSIENFLMRLESYTSVPPTNAMTDITVKIMIELLNIPAIATKGTRQGRLGASAFLSVILDCR